VRRVGRVPRGRFYHRFQLPSIQLVVRLVPVPPVVIVTSADSSGPGAFGVSRHGTETEAVDVAPVPGAGGKLRGRSRNRVAAVATRRGCPGTRGTPCPPSLRLRC
jgi:hypothetical protein